MQGSTIADDAEQAHEIGIYGHSDDLIEVVGAVADEIPANHDEPTYLGVGNSEITVEYDTEGVWRVEIERVGDGDECYHHDIGSPGLADETNEYTEGVVVMTDVAEVQRI